MGGHKTRPYRTNPLNPPYTKGDGDEIRPRASRHQSPITASEANGSVCYNGRGDGTGQQTHVPAGEPGEGFSRGQTMYRRGV